MTNLSIFLKNCFKIGNMSTDLPKAKSGLMLRNKGDRRVFWEAHIFCCFGQLGICNYANSLM